MLIVADTSPVNYLILVEADGVLPRLYGRILIPTQVLEELLSESAPERVRSWAASPPNWLDVRSPARIDSALQLDLGEAAAISLAQEVHADQLLMDDRDGRQIAASLGLKVAGTLAVIRDAAKQRLLDLPNVLTQLRASTFRAAPSLYQQLLDEFKKQS